jgi:ATP-dependent Lon protease
MSDETEIIEPTIVGPSGLHGIEVEVGTGSEDEPEHVRIPDELPVLPLKNTVLFPFLLSPLLVKSKRSRALIDDVLLSPDRLLVCVAVRHATTESPTPQDVYRTGTAMRIVKMLKFPDESYRLLVQGVARVRVDDFVSEDPYLRGRISRLMETGLDDSVETTALARSVAQEFAALAGESSRLSDELQVLATNLDDPSKLSDLVGSNLEFDVAGKNQQKNL